ncbi:hypothetical protein [Hymenobacter persicinus]|uniref:Outer membrane protein beta-barrel domain-containing protein n=1 Tax=Hymenobacter persicinus TaxID=2025506 RepID=A0A4Q5L9W6_9BACT|nr:hypothetical protein [Hymenobacter persicinus]RYU78623.1 hypothetical protein EWM57_13345 [Hymenobacter persicinus]
MRHWLIPSALVISVLFTGCPAAQAQHFTLEAGSGPCIGFTALAAPKGLPPKTRLLHRISTAFSLGLRYEAGHSLTVLAVNSAGLTRGVRNDALVWQRTANGAVVGSNSGSGSIRSAPAHFTLGSGYVTAVGEKLKLSALGGIGYMISVSTVPPPLTSIDLSPLPEERVDYVLNLEHVRQGNWGVFAEARAELQLSRRSSLGVTGRYYHGLRTIDQLKSELFRYVNTRTNTVEDYDVALLNKGRYVALRVSYGYSL